jgi:hypothetical protein
MRRQVPTLAYRPLIGLALVASDPDEVWIKSAVGSVQAQIYPHFELSLCDNGSERPHVREVIEEYADTESRTTALSLPKRTSRAAAYNAALAESAADYVALMEAGDELAPEALFGLVELLQGDSADVVYTDEDRADVSGRRSHPVFKPYWSPELLLSTPYIGRLCVIRRELFEAVGGLREGFEGAEEHDLMLRLSEWTDRIRHLPRILYRRRDLTTDPNADDRVSGQFGMPPAAPTAKRAVEEALDRRTDVAAVEQDLVRKALRVVRSPCREAGTSVIVFVPQGALPSSVLGELEREAYGLIREVIPASVDHEMRPSLADGRSHEVRHPFLARALNLAARRAEGEHLVFLDGRSELTDPGWLMELVGHTGRPGVGAVGCRLERSRGGLYYGGSFVDLSRITGRPEEVDFERREGPPLVDFPFNPLTVPIECLAVRRSVFEEAGGFDDENLPSAFYDLDLCLRLQEEGLRNVYTPYASVKCGDLRDANARVAPGEAEVAYVWRRWWEQLVWLLHYRFSPLHPTAHAAHAETLALLGALGSRRATH